MTLLKLIMFLEKKIGVFLILISIFCFLRNDSFSQETFIKISDLRQLAQKYVQNNQSFLAYIFNYSYYQLSKDPRQKLDAGLDALDICINTHHFYEGKNIYWQLLKEFPEIKNYLTYKYSTLLLNNKQFFDGEILLRDMPENIELSSRKIFLHAYALLNLNCPKESLESLLHMKDNKFPYNEQLKDIIASLNSKPSGSKKYKSIAIPLSIIIPGSGQLYSGFYFDAIHSFGYNLLFGYSSFAIWRYELSKERENRIFFFPILSSIISGIFYLTNIYNTANVVEKANLYRLDQHYRKIIDNFTIVLKDESYFFKIELDF